MPDGEAVKADHVAIWKGQLDGRKAALQKGQRTSRTCFLFKCKKYGRVSFLSPPLLSESEVLAGLPLIIQHLIQPFLLLQIRRRHLRGAFV